MWKTAAFSQYQLLLKIPLEGKCLCAPMSSHPSSYVVPKALVNVRPLQQKQECTMFCSGVTWWMTEVNGDFGIPSAWPRLSPWLQNALRMFEVAGIDFFFYVTWQDFLTLSGKREEMHGCFPLHSWFWENLISSGNQTISFGISDCFIVPGNFSLLRVDLCLSFHDLVLSELYYSVVWVCITSSAA